MAKNRGLIVALGIGFLCWIPDRCAALSFPKPDQADVVLIGWDGALRWRVEKMLRAGQLPNLIKLVREGGLTDTQVTTGATETKPGWSEVLTGHSADGMGIESNSVYKPIPKGYTVFEILNAYFKGRIATVFVAGKLNNLANRGPHEICINCNTRQAPDFEKTEWWDKEHILPDTKTQHDLPLRWVWREGEPYFNAAPTLDVYRIGLGAADHVGEEALRDLDRYKDSRFIVFFHFEEPDEQGHLFKENSEEYSAALRRVDSWLGRITDKLESLGLRDKTAVFVTTDHGFDTGRRTHQAAPDTFLATNIRTPLRKGDRKDITPTILQIFGVDSSKLEPKPDGQSLFVSGLDSSVPVSAEAASKNPR